MNRLKFKKLRNKSLKGMTLMEVIIAMVVLVIVATLVAEAGVGILNNVRTSKSVVQKVNFQSSFITSRNAAMTDSFSFKLADSSGSAVGSDISVEIHEAPVDAAGIYKDYDKAGNLKYFVVP